MMRSHFFLVIFILMDLAPFVSAATAAEASPSEPQQAFTNKPFHGMATIHSVTDKEMTMNTIAPYVSTIAKDPFSGTPKTFIGEINVGVASANKKPAAQ